MSSQQNIVDFLVEQMSNAGNVSSRKMFGDYAVYCDGKVVGLICDYQLFIKPTSKGKAFIGKCEEKPPYPSAKLYFLIPNERWDDDEWLSELVRITALELPLPKKKKGRL
jgi:TfoX/Sxy family transcriptional regulator of competence genes